MVRRAIQLMNRYGLTELEFEEKEEGHTLLLERSHPDASPPLLEGRSGSASGVIYAPTVGRLVWMVQEGDVVEEGEVLARIDKYEQTVDVSSPRAGRVEGPRDESAVEYGEALCRVVPGGPEAEQEGDGS